MHGTDQRSKCEIQNSKNNLLSQIAKYRILHALHELRKKRTRKTSVV